MSRQCPTCEAVFPDTIVFCGHDGSITIEVQAPGDQDGRLGTQLGDYVVVARVADGGMGRVYEGRHPETRQRVAIKVLHPHVAQDAIAVERFKREFETAAQLNHPHIVKVHEFGETVEGSCFMTMEFLVGEELGTALRRVAKQPLPRVIQTLCQSALALDFAHSFGVIHRDLKPGNIFLCSRETGDDVRLLDFGSVKLQMETGPKLTAFGTTLGSPYYMSPEQAMGKQDVDQRSDVFAMAAMLHEMLTGRLAFEGENVAGILTQIIRGTPTPPSAIEHSLPRSLDAVVARGLAKDKAERYASVSALAEAMLTALGLAGSVEQWANASAVEIHEALQHAVPPAPTALMAPPVIDAPPAMYEDGGDPSETIALPRSPSLKWVLLAMAMTLLLVLGAGVWLVSR